MLVSRISVVNKSGLRRNRKLANDALMQEYAEVQCYEEGRTGAQRGAEGRRGAQMGAEGRRRAQRGAEGRWPRDHVRHSRVCVGPSPWDSAPRVLRAV